MFEPVTWSHVVVLLSIWLVGVVGEAFARWGEERTTRKWYEEHGR